MFCSNCGKQNQDTARFCSACGIALSSQAMTGIAPTIPVVAPSVPPEATVAISPQSTLHGQYYIVKQLGGGGMGRAYIALDTQNFNRQCVVKEMLPYWTTPEEEAEAKRNFERECQLLAGLSYPTGIPQIFDHFSENNNFYLAMTLIEGEDLEKRMMKSPDGRLPERDVIRFGLQVCDILVYLANRQPPVIHRDIKPANLIVDQHSGNVMLVDFGIAKATRSAGTVGGAINTASWNALKSSPLGTAGYAPPEQYQGATEPRSDVYALGATMHHLLTGRSPQSAGSPFDFPPVRQFVPTLSEGIERVVSRALTMSVAQRPTAAQWKAELEAIASPSVVQSIPQTQTGPFHFRSGDSANTIAELTQKADANWNDGVYHLYQGHFETWLTGQSQHALATTASGIRQRGGDQSAGLEEFLRAANPQLKPPALNLGSAAIDFGEVSKGESRELDLQIANQGRGYMYGTIKSVAPWATPASAKVGCAAGSVQTVKIKLDTRSLTEGLQSSSVLEIDTNGGRQTISGRVTVTWATALTIKPDKKLSFGDVTPTAAQSVTRTLTITNSGGGTLTGTLMAQGGWFMLSTNKFQLGTGQKIDVQATANTAGLMVGVYQGQITIASNAGQIILPAEMGVKKAMYDLPSRAMRWGFFAVCALIALMACAAGNSLMTRGLLGLVPVNLLGNSYFGLMVRFGSTNTDMLNLANGLGAATLFIFGFIGIVVWTIAKSQNRALDEIEDYYHRGYLAQEIAPLKFESWRYFAAIVLLAVLGIPLGVRFNTATTGDWLGWGLLIGPVAGALIGGGVTVAGARVRGMLNAAAGLSVFERVFFVAFGMAMWGAMLSRTRSSMDWFPAFLWALAGLVFVSDSLRLPARLQWMLARLRPGLLIAFIAYMIETNANALISFFRFGRSIYIPFDAFYSQFPGFTDALQVVVDVMLALAILVGGLVGLALIGDSSLQRARVAKTVGLVLLPSLFLGVIGIALGGILWWILTLGRGWSLGVLFTTAIFIAAGLSLFRYQMPLIERGQNALGAQLARLLRNRPLPSWLKRFSLVTIGRDLTPAVIAIAAMLAAMLEPLAIQIALSVLILLMCLAVVAVGIGVVVFAIIVAARNQSGTAGRTP